ncbi:hypothetical protein MDA_GLEAN10013582 [Myotis davidii]|uniref:Uncharacterized protein n=1 Tax=Myotis davidii TaxID=225400 RepID=L5MG65_MYODS|nr:hypothetical protein MDA_GLEAN10013582 [Myotis davidii]
MYERAPRVLRFADGGSTAEHVGPGSYQVPFPKQQAAGGYAPFLSLAARNTIAPNTDEAIPGPAHYNVSEKKKISRLPSVFRMIVPSIPSYGRSYGYHINEDGSIIKHLPPASDITLGPAYYKPQFGFSNATIKYKGIHFGKSLGRLKLPIKSGPGPGQYDIVHCDVQKSYEMSQVQHRYMLPYGFVDKIKYTSFLITTPGDLDKVTDEPDK